MGNTFTALPALAGNGAGAWVDVSALGAVKTVICAGTTLGNTTIQISNELVPTSGAPVHSFQEGGKVEVAVAARWMRAVVSGYRRGGAPVVTVGAPEAVVAFAELVAPAGTGAGAGVDTATLGSFKTVTVGGDFRGTLLVEVSVDGGTTWGAAMSFQASAGGQQSRSFVGDQMRVRRVGVPAVNPGIPVVNIGAVPDGSLVADGMVNVEWFGAQPDLGVLFPQETFFQAAIDSLGATGGTVFVPKGTYIIAATLEIGGAGNYVEGIRLVGESSSVANLNTALRWGGAADGGPILRIRNASGGELAHLAFTGFGLASYCVQFTHLLGDVGIVTAWKVTQCNFRDAKISNVLVGEVGTDYGDCSCITFDTCYFHASSALVLTDAHVRQLAQFTFATTFVNCRFASDGTNYPLKSISLQAGTAVVVGGTMDVPGTTAIFMDAANGIPAPSICVYAVEVQSAGQLLVTAFAGTGFAAPLRATILSGIGISDIVGGVATPVIYWDADRFGSLNLQGVHLQQNTNIEIADATAKVFVQDVLFPPAGGAFTGVGAGQVCGTWWQQTRYYQRIPNVPEFANNAAALAGGLIAGDLFRITGGSDLQVVF